MNGSHETLREDSDSGPEGPNEAGRYVQANTRLYRSSEWNDANIKNIVVPGAQAGEGIGGRRPVEIGAGHGRFGAFEDDVLGLLHVDADAAQLIEHMREHTRPVAV